MEHAPGQGERCGLGSVLFDWDRNRGEKGKKRGGIRKGAKKALHSVKRLA